MKNYFISENRVRSLTYKKDESQESFLTQLNHLLNSHETPEYQELEISAPIFFIFGLPRSGTTILSQLLTYCLDVGYINNVIARFWSAPLTGIKLSKILLKNEKDFSFQSNLGQTHQLSEPHEFGYFWQQWLKKEQQADFLKFNEDEESIDWQGLKTCLANLQYEFAKPLLFRNNLGANHMPRFNREIPKLMWIYIHRDSYDVAHSIYQARKKYYQDKTTWWGTYPPSYLEVKDKPIFEQIAAQVIDLKIFYQQQLAQIPAQQQWTLSYEELCRSPQQALESLKNKCLNTFDYELQLTAAPPESIQFRNYQNDKITELEQKLFQLMSDV